MKKPSAGLFVRQQRIARIREVARRKRRGRKQKSRDPRRYVRPTNLIEAPRRIDLTRGSGRGLTKFLSAVAEAVLRRRLNVRLDFRRTETFYPAGTILLFAEIDRIVSTAVISKPITIIDQILNRPRQVLAQIGLHGVTGDRTTTATTREDVVYWKAMKGRDDSGQQLHLLEAIATRVNATHTRQIELSGIWRGVTEAVANAVEHAYKFPRSDGFSGLPTTKWWMFTQVRDGMLTVAVCDLGCGYRATVNQTVGEQIIAAVRAAWAGGNRDAIAIEAAMRYGRSGTRLAQRGKGSRDALSVLRSHGEGQLTIVSNSGWVHYSRRNGVDLPATYDSLEADLKGTIVWWKLPLKESEHESD